MNINLRKDTLSGLAYMLIGGVFAAASTSYEYGASGRMGPGYFPFWLGVVLAGVGALLVIKSLSSTGESNRVGEASVRHLATITLAILAFGLALEPLGAIPAIILLVVISSLAMTTVRWRYVVGNVIILSFLCISVFIYGLKLSIPILPAFIMN